MGLQPTAQIRMTPTCRQEIVDLVVRFARENVTWGYDKIQGALANLGHSPGSLWRLLYQSHRTVDEADSQEPDRL